MAKANKKSRTAIPPDGEEPADLKAAPRSPMPRSLDPMLCTLTKAPIADLKYLHEIKWDGYRIISYVEKGTARLDSRSALDYSKKYPKVVEALQELGHDAVIDGEVVVFNSEGTPDFDALQRYNGHNTPINYCVFDLLWLDGRKLMDLPLETRKRLLADLVKGHKTFRISESFDNGPALYQQMLDRNLEGIVSKRRDSAYHPGERANDWLKTPTRKRQEFVIGGWAESDKSRAFRSLLFGAYNGKNFEWIGRSGGGYKEKEMPDILKKLQSLETGKSPFANKVLDTKGATIHWVKPRLVANFEFATWTKSGRIRKPATFLGFRNDKKAIDVVREVPKPIDQVEEQFHEEPPKPKPKKTMAGSNWPKVESQPQDDRDSLDIGNCSVELYNVHRPVWRDIPKARLIQYYHDIAPYILPYLKDRPESLHIKPVNAGAPGFYIKDMEGRQPDCGSIFTDTRRHDVPGKPASIDYLVCNNEPTLLWMINLGCIDLNPWNSRVHSPDNPDFIAIDLDPSEKDPTLVNLDRLIDTALATKAWCDANKIKAFAKTSGKTGMHFYIPCGALTYPDARRIAERICAEVNELAPHSSTIENTISRRRGLVYIDPSQNDYADTLAAPYSVRPFHNPTVSTPLEWKEINRRLDPRKFTIDTILTRLKKKGDPFAGVFDKKIATANTKRLAKL